MRKKSDKISISTLAKEAGVSVATISRVLNQRTGVSEELRCRISALLRKHQFKANYPAPRSPKIAIVNYSGDMMSVYINKIVNAINNSIPNNDVEISVLMAQDNEGNDIKERLRDQQYSGAIILLAPENKEPYLELSKSGFPVIFIDDSVSFEGVGFVECDSYTGSRDAAKYLIELGHKNIGYLHYHNPKLSHIQRINGYRNALKDAGIEINPDYIVSLESKANGHIPDKRAYDAILKLLKRNPEITAVMTSDDTIAHGAICAIVKSGRRIPDDISIIGFGNNPGVEFYNPPLTTIDHPSDEEGKIAINSIIKYLTSHGETRLPQEIVDTHLVIRSTTAKVRNK